MKLEKAPTENGFIPDKHRYTYLDPDVIFVFGSNLQGIHGSGSARDALRYFQAVFGIGEGLQGQAYGLPTCDIPGVGLPLEDIQKRVNTFRKVVMENPRLSFIVTAVGCGYAGYSAKDIAPMFKEGFERCWFPESWRQYIEG